MAFLIDESFLPAKLTAPPMNAEEFAAFCSEHSDLRFEITAEGELLVMAPANTKTGVRNARIVSQLDVWAEQDGRGYVADSSSGFVLPSGAILSPDAAWIANECIDNIEPAEQDKFLRICPDFVIELKSISDRLPELREKMKEWIANGAQLGWLIEPKTRSVEVYRPGREPEVLVDPPSVTGEGPVAGFVLVLGQRFWEPFVR
jgi:Uma2 family endonuclease